MQREPLRFRKSRRSGANSNCVEVAHTLSHVRDSKHPDGPVLRVHVRGLAAELKAGRFER